jgi:hypothetical protein
VLLSVRNKHYGTLYRAALPRDRKDLAYHTVRPAPSNHDFQLMGARLLNRRHSYRGLVANFWGYELSYF